MPACSNTIYWIDTAEKLEHVAEVVDDLDVIGLDVETGPNFERLALVQISTDNANYLIDPLAVSLAPLIDALELARPTKVIHCAQFERRVLGELGIVLAGVYDTHAESKRLRGNVDGGHSLAAVSLREFGVYLDKNPRLSDWRARPLSPEQMLYAAADAEVLLRLHAKFTGRA